MRFFVLMTLALNIALSTKADPASWARMSDFTQYASIAYAGTITFSKRDRLGASQLVLNEVLSNSTSEALKRLIDKPRPDALPGATAGNSFPSGHTMKAWSAAAHLQRRYGCYQLRFDCWKTSLPAYALSVATAAGRVNGDKHFIEDVAASALIAEAFAWGITSRFETKNRYVRPTFSNGFGIRILQKF